MRKCISETELCFDSTTNNPNVVLCKGKPRNIDYDVQYYYFKCNCQEETQHQPQFMKFVKDGLEVMCSTCAEKLGFNDIFHNNGSKEMIITGEQQN